MSIVVLIFMLIIICILISHMSSISIYNDYLDGEYIIVEGTISNYEIGTGERGAYPDRFTVQGVDFIISDNNSTGYGYSLRHSNGGLLENGKKCKIYYIPYKGENVIMKLYLYNE